MKREGREGGRGRGREGGREGGRKRGREGDVRTSFSSRARSSYCCGVKPGPKSSRERMCFRVSCLGREG